MTVGDLIGSRQEVFFIRDDMTVYEAARYLREKRVRTIGVQDSRGSLVGIGSQSDISDKVAAENRCPSWMHVSEIMTRDLVTVSFGTHLDECLRLMEKHNIYHLVVMDDKAGFRGMISVKNLLKIIASHEKSRADMLEAFAFSP